MKFTKQHFNEIAIILREHNMEIKSMEKNNEPLTYEDVKDMHVHLVRQFILLFKACNPHFNEDKFLDNIY